MAEIRIENLHKAFGDFTAVKNSNLTVGNGEFFVMLGPSGCGKTTTLRMIAGLELPTSGRILLDGEDVTFRRARERDIAFVFQLFALYPHMTVRQNIAFPLKCQGMAAAERRRRADETARLLRIDHLLDQPVSRLSGGDRQRVALGRAIVREPKAFLMDEPLGALDAEFRHIMCQELRALHDRVGATTVYVTHDQLEAMSMADKIAVMNQGVVEQYGTPQEIYDRPATHVRRRFRRLAADELPALLLGALAPGDRGGPAEWRRRSHSARSTKAAPRATWSLGVRPEHIRLAAMAAACAPACSARSIWAPRRSSPSIPSMARSRRACRPMPPRAPAKPSASPSARRGCRCSTRRRAGAAPCGDRRRPAHG